MGKLAVSVVLIMGLFALPDAASAYSYRDTIFELGFDSGIERIDRNLACERIEMLRLFGERITYYLDVENEASSEIRAARPKMRSLDAANLYDRLSYSDAQGVWHALGLRGGWDSTKYRTSVTDPGTEEWAASFSTARPEPWGRQKYFGDLGLRAFIRPTREDAFRVATEGQLHLADLPAANVVRAFQGMLRATSFQAVHGEDPPASFLSRRSLDHPELKVLYAFATDFPHLFQVISRYFVIEDIFSRVSEGSDALVVFNVKVRLSREAFEQDYPSVGRLLDRLENMGHVSARIFDDQARVVATATFDMQSFVLHGRLAMRNGRIVPISEHVVTGETRGFSPTDPGDTRFRGVFNIRINAAGLHLDVNALEVALDYSYGDHGAHLKAQLMRPPHSVKASGYAMGILPIWLIDLLIPSTVEDMTREFFYTLATGNGGRGAVVKLGNYPEEALRRNLWVRTDAEVFANGMMKFGFNLYRSILVDVNELGTDAHKFWERLWNAVSKDVFRCSGGRLYKFGVML